jgi:septal ring factor EnvC (AmiA/AmiB activator)
VIRTRHFILVSACALVLATGGAIAATSSSAKQELRELRGKIEALQKRLAEAEETKSETVDALRESERAISDANRSLRELQAQARSARAQLAELRAESRRGEGALKEQQQLLERLLYQQYVNGRSEPLKLLLNREDPNRIARQLQYFSYISRARADLVDELRENLSRLDALSRDADAKAKELDAIAGDQAAQQKRLAQEQAARKKVLASISRDIQQHQREIGTLKRNENRLTRLIEQLGRVTAKPRSRSPLRNERLPDSASDGTPFEALRGTLALPVRGELGNRFGSPREDSGLTWKGLFIAARPGTEVKAIAAGRVVFADWLRGFGNLLIIDHGGAYMSLYGNNETLFKQVGDSVRGGDTVAAVGNSGGNVESGLYFEIRHQGKPFDPLAWVNVR